jgi:NADH dehydrogenase
MEFRTICMLGGTGFVGGHLAARLVAGGHTVKILTRNPARHHAVSVLPTVRLAACDVYDEEALLAEFRGCDAVINLVGILNETGGATFRKTHVELPRKVAQACRAAGVKRLLHMSALGADAGNAPSLYLRTKGEGEAALHVHAGGQVAYTVFQPSVIFGLGDSFINRFAGLLRMTPLMFPLACPDAKFQPVFVGDVAQAFVNALGHRESFGRRYTLCGPQVYTLEQIVRFVAREAGVRRWIWRLPGMLGKLQAMTLQMVPGTPFSLDNWHSLQVDSVCKGDSGLARLGITPTSMAVTVPRYLGGEGHRNRLSGHRGAAH